MLPMRRERQTAQDCPAWAEAMVKDAARLFGQARAAALAGDHERAEQLRDEAEAIYKALAARLAAEQGGVKSQ